MLRIWALITVFCPSGWCAEPTIESALQSMYDFDFPASHEILDRYIGEHPQDPLPYAFRASAYLFYELDRLGILESEFLVDDNKIAEKKKKLDPDPENRARFVRAVNDAETRVDAILKGNPNDRDALFAMCIAQGVTTDYMAFVEKKQISSLSVAKRSNNYAQRLLRLDPKFYDAYLTAGITEYMLGSLPFGLATAIVLARGRFWGKSVLDGVVHLPLVMPPVVTGYLLLLLFGGNRFSAMMGDVAKGIKSLKKGLAEETEYEGKPESQSIVFRDNNPALKSVRQKLVQKSRSGF